MSNLPLGEMAKAASKKMLDLGFVPGPGDGMTIVNAILPFIEGPAPAKEGEPVKASGTVGAVVKGAK